MSGMVSLDLVVKYVYNTSLTLGYPTISSTPNQPST